MTVRFSHKTCEAERVSAPLSVAHGRFSRVKQGAAALLCLAMLATSPAYAQGNDDDHTPLGSRIKRDRQFPLALPQRWGREQNTAVNRERSKSMLSQFSNCLYSRAKTSSLDLLRKTDPGFVDFLQVDMEVERTARIFGFQDCLSRVAQAHNMGVNLRWTAMGLRQWLVQEAYFDRYRNGADWVKPGNVIAERTFVLPQRSPGIRVAMDFADCVVANDPNGADYYYRSPAGSVAEKEALQGLTPVLAPCFPAGQRATVQPEMLRIWLGEALWHASNNNAPAQAGAAPSKVAE